MIFSRKPTGRHKGGTMNRRDFLMIVLDVIIIAIALATLIRAMV